MCQPSASAVQAPRAVGLSGTDPPARLGLGLAERELGLARRPWQLEQEAPSWHLLT